MSTIKNEPTVEEVEQFFSLPEFNIKLPSVAGRPEQCHRGVRISAREHNGQRIPVELILAAPQMLLVLQMIVSGYEVAPLPGFETDVAAARAVIAAATGGKAATT